MMEKNKKIDEMLRQLRLDEFKKRFTEIESRIGCAYDQVVQQQVAQQGANVQALQKALDKLSVELEKQKEKLDAKMEFISKIDRDQDSDMAAMKQALFDQ